MTRPLVFGLLIAAALLGPAVFWHNGVIDREATTFVRQYVADRPLIAKVFDPHANDIGTYQARELSYFLDYLDAAVYEWTARRTERAFFIPFSALVASALFVVTFLAGARRSTTHVDFLTGALLLACLLSSFAFVSTMGVLYRSSKPVLAVALLAWMFQVRIAHRNRSQAQGAGRPMKRDAAFTFVLALIAGLLDRQGFFYVLAGCALLFVHVRLTDGELRDLLKATVAAALALVVYNVALAPLVIHGVNGYWPDFSYQRVPLLELLSRPQIHMSRAGRLLFMNLAMLFGGFTGVALVIIVGTSLLAWSRFKAPFDVRNRQDAVRYLLHDHRGRVVAYRSPRLWFSTPDVCADDREARLHLHLSRPPLLVLPLAVSRDRARGRPVAGRQRGSAAHAT